MCQERIPVKFPEIYIGGIPIPGVFIQLIDNEVLFDNEEAQSDNEEVQSDNEEVQSDNDALSDSEDWSDEEARSNGEALSDGIIGLIPVTRTTGGMQENLTTSAERRALADTIRNIIGA